ncbi:hypothetical protein V5N11_013676 [Cardamine amara subsp. amara]|uniref:Uncharacterized protein n=1 Tax=Cardamine amara subsp. amara TaxID=228776 RepID=A0ABD1A4S2_CARAN
MGNSNATASLIEEESSKQETNGISPLDSVSVETTQDQVFLAGEGKDGDKEKESLKLEETNGMSPLNSVSVDTTQDQVFLEDEGKDDDQEQESLKLETNGMPPLNSVSVETTEDQLFLAGEGKHGDEEKEILPSCITETEPQSKELVDEPKVKNVKEEMHQSGLESSVMETDEQLQKQTSVAEGVETVCEVAELPIITTQSFVSKLNTTEPDNEEKLSVIDDNITEGVQTVCEETEVEELLSMTGTEAKMINESLEEIVSSEEDVKLDQETGIEQKTEREELPEIEPQEILNLDYLVVDYEEVTNEEKADKAIPNPISQESNAIQESGIGVYKEEKGMELKRKASLKRMSRCRSLPVSHNSRVIGDSVVQNLVSEVVFPSRNKKGLEKANASETMLVSCVGSNKTQEATEVVTEGNKEARFEMRSPSFGNDLRIEERNDEPTEKTPLLCQDKTEIYEETIDVEEKTVMLKRSESVKTRGLEMSVGFLKKHSNSFKETKGSGDNLLDKKASSGAMKGIVRKRSKSSLLGTCLCCTTSMN